MKVCILCGNAVILAACTIPWYMSASLNETAWSPVFITTTTTFSSGEGVRKAVHSRVELITSLEIWRDPRGTNLLQVYEQIEIEP